MLALRRGITFGRATLIGLPTPKYKLKTEN